jgi:hypothetical protein
MNKPIWVEIIKGDDGVAVAALRLKSQGFEILPGVLDLTREPKKIEYFWKDFKVFSVEGSERLQKGFTFRRLLTMGIFVFTKKRKLPESFLFSEMVDGSTLILKFVEKSVPEVNALFAPYRSQLPR